MYRVIRFLRATRSEWVAGDETGVNNLLPSTCPLESTKHSIACGKANVSAIAALFFFPAPLSEFVTWFST